MRTPEVTREFRDKCKELAALSNIPGIKARLWRLANKYDELLGDRSFRSAVYRSGERTASGLEWLGH